MQGSDVYRINDLMGTVKAWQTRAILQFASSSFPLFRPGPDTKGRHRARGGGLHGGTLTLAGWSDAAYGDLSQNGKRRLGYLIGITSSSLAVPCHVLRWASKFTRKLAKSSLGGEA